MFVVLVAVFGVSGYVARQSVTAREMEIAARKNKPVLSLSIGTRIASADLESAGNVDLRPLETLLSVVTNLRQHYVEQLTVEHEGNMTYGALESMLRSFKDPNTRFIEPAQRKIMAEAMEGSFHGIGAWLGIEQVTGGEFVDEHLIVIATLRGSPAERAGLKPGDDIVAIDGKRVLSFDPYQRLNEIMEQRPRKVADYSEWEKRFEAEKEIVDNGIAVFDAEDLLSSEDSKTLELTILSVGATEEAKVSVQPGAFTLEPVTQKVEAGNYAYVRINCFCTETGEQFAEAMRGFDSKGLNGLVLDLRNVSGGDMGSALQVAKWFAPGKKMATLLRSRNRKTTLDIPDLGDDHVWRRPVAVLVNRGTARTPEVLASALKENGVARLVGEKTYGDFLQTTLIDQLDGSAILLTTGKYLTSRGGNYWKTGLPVDVAVAAGPTGDPQLDEAVRLLGSPWDRS